MKVYFIRHGKTKGNKEGRYVGRTDEALLADYVFELKEKNMPVVDSIYVSPMRRCIETCHHLYPGREYEIVEELKEMDFGDYENKTFEELKSDILYQSWLDSKGEMPFPNGESMVIFQKRCKSGFERTIEEAMASGYKEIAVVAHGGTIMALLDEYSYPHKDYFHWQTKNGCGYEGKIQEVDGRMVISSLQSISE